MAETIVIAMEKSGGRVVTLKQTLGRNQVITSFKSWSYAGALMFYVFRGNIRVW